MKILEKQLTVNNSKGIHGRIATKLIQIAGSHEVRMYIMCEGETFDCSSVLDILSIALVHGTTFRVKIEGEQAEGALTAIEKVISSRDES